MAKDAALCRSWLEVQAVWLVAETKKKKRLGFEVLEVLSVKQDL